MTKNNIIEFECIYGTAKFAGYAYANELDDDEPLHFYTEEDKIKLYEAITSDNLLLQCLADFKDEQVTFDREDYTLHINGGAQLEMCVEKNDEWDMFGNHLNAKISFKFRNTILNEDLINELCDDLATTWNDETYKILYGENAICLNIDNEWWEEEVYGIENKRRIEEEMLADAEKLFVRQVIMDMGVYITYQDVLEHFLMKHDDKKIFDKSYIRGAADNYEQILEESSLNELNDYCSKSLKEEMLNDIEEDYF